ncbi:MAG TPA: [protein-PII] uridylyltransferase [Burkholderiales bacterium]|nr:[protein-PII] uridylyltransferase [Burkholderiales bacterium]
MADTAAPQPIARMPPFEVAVGKQMLADGRARVRDAYLRKPSSRELLQAQARMVDELLRFIWRELALPRTLTLAAVGGYGRGELYPWSDVDVLILLPQEPDAATRRSLEHLVGLMWDIGLEIGHSVRTVEQCLEEAAKDVTVQTNLMEARLVAGSAAQFRDFAARTAAAMDLRAFASAKLLEQQQRHARQQDAAYKLEPNVKESPGGLRDLQTVLWISRAAGFGSTWEELARQGIVTSQEALQVKRREAFLQDLRIRLHYLAGRREDRLLFDHQTALAQDLGLTDHPPRLASELLMQRFFVTAKAVAQLNTLQIQNLQARIFPVDPSPPVYLNERFRVRNQLLEARNAQLFEREPRAILESFLLLQQHSELKGIAAPTLRALWRASHGINAAFRADARNRALFMEMLRQPDGQTHALRRLNQYGILGRYIPAFGRIVGQMQHDLYHVYPVDEHILMVLRNVRRFAMPEHAHEYPLCSRLMSEFERPEVLYLAALFHDIAKGRGGDHSLLGAVEARRFCREHGLAEEDTSLVAWLVEHHLVMSATAQKKDLSDPQVIDEFARLVASERRLVALYLLTVADIRGTSPKVWNAWKGKLLEDLYGMTRRRIAGTPGVSAHSIQARQQEALSLLALYAVPAGAQDRFWSQLDTVYFLRHDADEIAWHTRLLNYRVDPGKPIVKARLSPAGEGLQVMIYIPDQKELFARICGFFARTQFNIAEAKIHTTRHGYALDTFQVMDPSGGVEQYRDLMSFIEYELAERLARQAPLDAPVSGRVSRRLKHFPVAPEVSIRPDDRGTHYILSVTAGDRPGLLYRVARVLVSHGISVQNAKINTLGERAEDVFLISGGGLSDPKTVVRIETDLLGELQ